MMAKDTYEEIAECVIAIKSDPNLRKAFLGLLQVGSSSQQVRVQKMKSLLETQKVPTRIERFMKLLENDKIAGLVYHELVKA